MEQPGFLKALMEKLEKESPLSVMTRATLEQALTAVELVALLERRPSRRGTQARGAADA